MRFVVDSNVLFTFFWKNSVFKSLCQKKDLKLFAPEYALKEISKYSSEIARKAKLSKEEFGKIREELVIRVEFIPLKGYSSAFKQANDLLKDSSNKEEFLKDMDFFALALKLGVPIWTNDKLLREQEKILILTTESILLVITPPD